MVARWIKFNGTCDKIEKEWLVARNLLMYIQNSSLKNKA